MPGDSINAERSPPAAVSQTTSSYTTSTRQALTERGNFIQYASQQYQIVRVYLGDHSNKDIIQTILDTFSAIYIIEVNAGEWEFITGYASGLISNLLATTFPNTIGYWTNDQRFYFFFPIIPPTKAPEISFQDCQKIFQYRENYYNQHTLLPKTGQNDMCILLICNLYSKALQVDLLQLAKGDYGFRNSLLSKFNEKANIPQLILICQTLLQLGVPASCDSSNDLYLENISLWLQGDRFCNEIDFLKQLINSFKRVDVNCSPEHPCGSYVEIDARLLMKYCTYRKSFNHGQAYQQIQNSIETALRKEARDGTLQAVLGNIFQAVEDRTLEMAFGEIVPAAEDGILEEQINAIINIINGNT